MLSLRLCSFQTVAACSTLAYEAMQLKSYIYDKQNILATRVRVTHITFLIDVSVVHSVTFLTLTIIVRGG